MRLQQIACRYGAKWRTVPFLILRLLREHKYTNSCVLKLGRLVLQQ